MLESKLEIAQSLKGAGGGSSTKVLNMVLKNEIAKYNTMVKLIATD